MNVRAPYRCICLVLLLGGSSTSAQIVTDGTVGPATSLSGPEMTIGAELGSTRGANLFHSFQRFDIPTGQRATFTGPDQIRNVIGRVTGGQTSSIDGTLRSTVGQADVYLINPSGIVMGPNARVDVPAALHLSTADELRFSDGSNYSARDSSNSTLTLATPESFGFLSPQPASLTIEGSQLWLRSGKTVTLTAGDVSIVGTSERQATLKAPGGEIRIEAVGDQGGQVSVTTPSQQPGSGRLSLDQAYLDTSWNGAGRLSVRAGEATLNTTTLASDNLGDRDAATNTASIDVAITDAFRLSGAQLSSHTFASGAAGDIRLDVGGVMEVLDGATIGSVALGLGQAGGIVLAAGSLRLDGLGTPGQVTGIASQANDSIGDAGTVSLTVAGLLEVLNGAQISSDTRWLGKSGVVTITAESVRLDGLGAPGQFTGIASGANRGSIGDAGMVSLTVAGLLEVLNGAVISSATAAQGSAGEVRIAAGAARLDGLGAPGQVTGILNGANRGSSGDAGTVGLTVAGRLEVLNGAEIASSTWGPGKAGDVTLTAGSMRLDGLGSPDQFTGIASGANRGAVGNAGTVGLMVDGLLEVLNGAEISSNTFAEGAAGDVRIVAGSTRLDGGGIPDRFTGITSSAESGSIGDAGTVSLTVAGLLEVLDRGQLSTSTSGAGNAGDLYIKAEDLVILGQDSGAFSAANPSATGQVGNISIDADTLTVSDSGVLSITARQTLADSTPLSLDRSLKIDARRLRLDDSLITASSTGNVPAAAIQIQSHEARLIDNSHITTAAAQADAGPITISGNRLWLTDSLITTSVTGEAGNGGNITLTPNYLILDGGFVQANTAAAGARGGDILIDTRALVASESLVEIGGAVRQDFAVSRGRNIIQAAAPGGEQGTIDVTSPDLNITAALVPLATVFDDPDDLLTDLCRGVTGAAASSLVERGAGGVPPTRFEPAAVSFVGTRLDRLNTP